MSKVHAVAVTYERPDVLAGTLRTVVAQTIEIGRIVVVDNGRFIKAAKVASELGAEYVDMPHNVGPAGGFPSGVAALLRHSDVADDDLVLFVDDDDPLRHKDEVARLVAFCDAERSQGRRVGAVGRCGVRLGREGRLHRVPDDELVGAVRVQSIGNGQAPLYLVEALRRVQWTMNDLFFGYEELALGLAIERSGYQLIVPGEVWAESRRTSGVFGMDAQAAKLGREPHPWRRYYSARNLIRVVREYRGGAPALLTTASSVAGGLRSAIRTRKPGPVVATVRGAIDGWRGVGGLTVAPQVQKRG